ncbi:hypothetical protein [Blastococcus sp. URHD0036]|uniref:hypothetical protein n=1 Tax=Blastococcus sp. URHD0036 TaxID=1380356 RepID=UPI0012DCB8E0|nr:hypothetical protein [Blastococcus sp. URHD0036]
MGRHAAPVGAEVDPVVAAALAQRPDGGGPRHSGEAGERREGPVGWPGREDDGAPAGSPVGWPGDITGEPVQRPAREAEPAPERATGWRRLFGGRAA